LIHSDPSQFTPYCPFENDSRLRQLEAELAESRRQFKSAMSSLSGVFYRCELDAPWATSFLSEGVEALTGFSAAELELGSGWADLMRPEDQSAVEAAVAEAISVKESFEIAYGITTKSGEVRWVSERGCAVYSDDGAPLFLEGVIRDISGRREADELQKALILRWRKTLDAIPQMVWTMAADGSEGFFNSQWERFTGCKVNRLQDLGELNLVHVDDRAQALARWNEKLTAGGLYEAQYRLRHASGEYRWVLSRGEPEKDRSGKVVRWYGTCTDIHDQVKAREALQASEALNRSMVDASPDSIAEGRSIPRVNRQSSRHPPSGAPAETQCSSRRGCTIPRAGDRSVLSVSLSSGARDLAWNAFIHLHDRLNIREVRVVTHNLRYMRPISAAPRCSGDWKRKSAMAKHGASPPSGALMPRSASALTRPASCHRLATSGRCVC
jgi:PAS domain S-box-containing protein